jgi:hypothetical protein
MATPCAGRRERKVLFGTAEAHRTEENMKRFVLAALAAAALDATAASAQGVQIGPGGVSVDPGYDRRDYDRGERRWREGRRGGGDCRTIIVKKEDQFGRRITKRIERCD